MPEFQLGRFQEDWRRYTSTPLRFLGGGIAEAPEPDNGQELVGRIESTPGVGAEARLGAYRQQYWYRLFTLLQSDFPLAGHLIGWEEFNPLASAYLQAHPPGRNLSQLGSRFPSWLRSQKADPVLIEACRVDAAWTRTFFAPEQPSPQNEHLESLGSGKLDLGIQASVQVLQLDRDWFALRHALLAGEDVPDGPPGKAESVFVLSRQGRFLSVDRIDAQLARILESMRRGSGWMNVLERAVSRKPALAEMVPRWFALGTQRQWWALT